jgi:benzylsuccinate CoA-transferase BbsF subunit
MTGEKMTGLLSGVRVADFSWVQAGPFVSECLAQMGAEVIKIESRKQVDLLRQAAVAMGIADKEEKDLDKSVEFNAANLNKLSICLDLKNPKGLEIAKKIISISDVVLESFSPGVIGRVGLSYEEVKTIRPDIIMLSLSYSGQIGPESKYSGYAALFYVASGLSYLTGYPDGPPGYVRLTSDNNAGAAGAVALLAALCHRERTGEGQYIDLSARESLSCLMGHYFIEVSLGRSPTRTGNLDENMVPHNCYPCSGEENWISIAIEQEEEWHKLCEVLGDPSLAEDPRFHTPDERLKNRIELDNAISRLTQHCDKMELMSTLQEAGIAAFPVLRASDIFSDPHLRYRGFITDVKHAKLGKQIVFGPPWKFSLASPKITSPAPLLGEHNTYVLKELLKMTHDQIEELERDGIIC